MKIVVDAYAWLPLSDLTHMQRSALKATLTVTPRAFPGFPGPPPSPIPLYAEKPDFLGVPRSFFMAHKKDHHEIVDMTTEGRKDLWDGPFTFAGDLRPTQQAAIDKLRATFTGGFGGGIIKAAPGWGKCLHPDTPVMRFDGTVVPVKTIRSGDLLMGPDSRPRRVLSTGSGRGPMFRITPVVGDPWECNDQHILSLVDYRTNAVRDIPLQDYLKMGLGWKHRLKQFSPHTGVDFPPAPPLPLDPYFMGFWYGDGTKALNGVAISKPDPEVLQMCEAMARQFGLRVRTDAVPGKCPTHHIVSDQHLNPLLTLLRSIVGTGETTPHNYLTASRADRRQFLAGWLDSDGYHNNGCYEVVQKNKGLADGIVFVARSLGIRATVRPKESEGTIYWRVKLAGDFIDLPLRIPRKKPRKRLQIKTATRTGFKVEQIADGEFFGVVLDGDHRYLMGDFTVTHNTVTSCAAMALLNVPTLVIVHKEFLLNQWRDRINQFLPGAKVGIVQQDRCEFKGCSVAIAMIHSLVGDRDYGSDFWEWPGLVLVDECFPAGTKIALAEGASKPIDQVVVGDSVLSAYGEDTVTDVMRREVPVARMRLVRFSDGSEQICTQDHPFLCADHGWTPAQDLTGKLVLTAAGCFDTMSSHGTKAQDSSDLRDMPKTVLSPDRASVLLSSLYGGVQTATGPLPSVRVVWEDSGEASQISFLRSCLSSEGSDGSSSTPGSGDVSSDSGLAQTEPEHRFGGFGANARAQPYALGDNPREGVHNTPCSGTSTPRPRGERSRADRPTADFAGTLRIRVGDRTCDSNTPASEQHGSDSGALQDRSGSAKSPPSGGAGRPESRITTSTETGSQERHLAALLRVDSVTIPEQADLDRLGISVRSDTGDVAVFNISVSRHPSYILHASKVVVHNCHRLGADTWSRASTKFNARWRIGVSATPRRKDGAEAVFFHQIGPVIYLSEEQRLKPKVRRVWTDFKLVQTPTLNPEIISKNVLLKFLCGNAARNKLIVEQLVLAVVAGRKPIVLSERLNHLDLLEALFKQQWKTGQTVPVPSTGFYVGGMKEEELEAAAEAQVIFATRQFAEEGLDIPALDTIFLTVPFSDVDQAVGRILRPCDGKKDPVVVDIIDPKVSLCVKSATYRDRFYKTKGWE